MSVVIGVEKVKLSATPCASYSNKIYMCGKSLLEKFLFRMSVLEYFFVFVVAFIIGPTQALGGGYDILFGSLNNVAILLPSTCLMDTTSLHQPLVKR